MAPQDADTDAPYSEQIADLLLLEHPAGIGELHERIDALAALAVERAADTDRDIDEVVWQMVAFDIMGSDDHYKMPMERVCYELRLFTRIEEEFEFAGDEAVLEDLSLSAHGESVAGMDVTHHLAHALQRLYIRAITRALPSAPAIQMELKLTQEGVSLSLYDTNAPVGSEFWDEWWATWGELGLTLHPEADAVEARELIVRADGEFINRPHDR